MPNHMDIYGHYVSLHNEPKKLYLGCSVKDALNNVDEKNSCCSLLMSDWFLQSHWDGLPPEILDYVLSLATWEPILVCRNNELLRSLYQEILDYAKLKQEWGIGHIKNVVCRCGFPCC